MIPGDEKVLTASVIEVTLNRAKNIVEKRLRGFAEILCDRANNSNNLAQLFEPGSPECFTKKRSNSTRESERLSDFNRANPSN